MTDNRIIEGVGKKIVDALRQQSDFDVQNTIENTESDQEIVYNNDDTELDFSLQGNFETNNLNSISTNYNTPQTQFTHQQSFKEVDNFASELDELDMPTNVAVLKQLISQLPASVSKQTGAQIIKQTMEALGIPMKNVLQEAQQVQENLNNKSRECLTSIVEYKKQITVLEKQSQKLQRQSSSLNDIISLFIQTGI